MSNEQDRVLQRLTRCAVWTETGRADGLVFLQGFDGRRVRRDELPESVLNQLLSAGKVSCDTQQRILENPMLGNPKPHEVTQKYWSVAKDTGGDDA